MNDILPPHLEIEIDALRADIKEHGLQSPVVLDEHDEIIDGRLRAKICDEFKIDWKQGASIRPKLSDEQKQVLRIRLNVLRRSTPPTAEQRREYARIFILAHPEMSDGSIAQILGVSQPTINRHRGTLVANGEIAKVEATVGRDGKRRRVKQTIVKNRSDYEHTAAAIQSIPAEDIPDGLHFSRCCKRIAGRNQKLEELNALPTMPRPEHVQLHLCDFSDLQVEPESVDLVMTDVLWERKAVPEWSVLAELALKWLKPDGLLVTYIGTHFLSQLMRSMEDGGLQYQWNFVLHFERNFRQKEMKGIYSCYRPVVAFSRPGKMHHFNGMPDVIAAGTPEKDYHPYQQDLSGVQKFVEGLSRPGDLVIDPCMGTGTTALACMAAAGGFRRFIGCDRDEAMYGIAQGRVNQQLGLSTEVAA